MMTNFVALFTRVQTYTHTYTHTQTHTRTHINTHINTHTLTHTLAHATIVLERYTSHPHDWVWSNQTDKCDLLVSWKIVDVDAQRVITHGDSLGVVLN